MFKNKNKEYNKDILLSLQKFNAKLKREKLRSYVDELDRLADRDLQAIYADVAKMKQAFLAKKKSSR